METSKSCPKCRHFSEGFCHLNPPPHAAVSAEDWCGKFSLMGLTRGSPSKISDETVIAKVVENWTPLVAHDGKMLPPVATRRTDLISDLMELGVSQTPILKRITKLVAQGRLMMGNDPDGKRDGIFVWPAEEASGEEEKRAGRPVVLGRDELCGMIAELAPGREAAVSLRAVHRAIGGRVSLGALHGAVKELVAAGRVVQDDAGVYVAGDGEMPVG